MTILRTQRGLETARMYAGPAPLPYKSKIIGTVTRNTGEQGTLLLLNSGIYVQYNAGTIRTLDQRKVKTLLRRTYS